MDRPVVIMIVFYVLVLTIILYTKPDFLFDYSQSQWRDDKFMNVTTFAIILSVLIFVYIKKTYE